MKFVNYSNFEAPNTGKVSKSTLVKALLEHETKNQKKVESLVEGLDNFVNLNEAISLFTDKLKAISVLKLVEADKKPGPDPYMTGLDDETEEDKEEQMKKQAKMDDDDPNAYKEMPGDKEAREKGKVKTSKHTKAYDELYGEEDANEAKKEIKYYKTVSKKDWEKAPKDYKSTIDGEHYMMFLDDKLGSILAPVKVEEAEVTISKEDMEKLHKEGEVEIDGDTVKFEEGLSWDSLIEKINEDWGSSDQSIMNKAIHKDAGSPKNMPSPFDKKLRAAAEDAVDFYWDDWKEYETDRDGLIDNAVRRYLRSMFPKEFDMMVRMFEQVDESLVLEMDSEGVQSLADELNAEVYTARLKDGAKSATIKATTTTKTWDDGAPILKFLARGKATSMQFTLHQRPFTVLHDVSNGWFYFTDGRKWYGLHGDEGYFEPEDLPFDMKISEAVVTEAGINDPVLMSFRAAKMNREKELAKPKRRPLYGKQRQKAEDDLWDISQELKELYAERGQLLIDMEQEAEVEGGPIADEYGTNLDVIEIDIQNLIAKRNKLEMRLAESVEVVEELNERSINKIQKDWAKVTADMKTTVDAWKGAEGAEKEKMLAKLKELTAKKKGLEAELDDVVGLKDADAELVGESIDGYALNMLADGQLGMDPASEFLSKHNVDLNALKKAKIQKVISSYEIRDVVQGKASKSLEKEFFKNYVKESVVTEATMQEIDKKVQKFVIKNANDYEYSNQDSAFQIYLSLKKLYPKLIKESVVTEAKPAGLTKEETLKVAQKFADAIAEVDGVKVTVNMKTLEEDSFDLDYDGTEFDGGSYNINDDGSVVNMAVRKQPTVGTKDDDVKTIVKFMKKHYGKLAKNESVVTEEEDYSDEMSYGQLESCIDNSTMIRDRIKQGVSLDPWMHSQIAVAKNELTSVFDALDGDDGVVEAVTNEKLDANAMAQKVMKELDTFAQLDPQYQPKEVLSTIEGVLKKYKSLYGGKLIQKVGSEIRSELEETGNLANDAYRHIKDVDYIIMNALTESFVNEDLRSDIKKYIKKNRKEIDILADRDDWDGIYIMLMNDFEVEDGSEEAEDLKQTFNFIY